MPMTTTPALTLAQAASPSPAAGPAVSAPPLTSDQALTASPGAATTAAPGTPAANAQQGPSMIPLLVMVTLFLGLMMFMTSRQNKKEKKRVDDMRSALKRGDKVVTVGGQLGTVDSVRDHEVVLRIDENSNVKARFTLASIQQVLESASGGAEKPSVEVKTAGVPAAR